MNDLKQSIGTILPAMRISFALVLLTTCVLLAANLLGFSPDETKYTLDSRKKVSEALTIQFSMFASERNTKKIHSLIRYIVKRNPDILSAGVRLRNGKLIFQSGKHTELWKNYKEKKSTASHVLIPIMKNGRLWANVEIRYTDLNADSFEGFLKQDIFKMSAFILLVGFFVYLVFMLRTLRQLDPSAVIPDRVNAAFDTLSEGLVILDEKEQIVLANKAFVEKIGRPDSSLLGIKMSELSWKLIAKQKSSSAYPWVQVMKNGISLVGSQLLFKTSTDKLIKFVLNVSPIVGNEDGAQGY